MSQARPLQWAQQSGLSLFLFQLLWLHLHFCSGASDHLQDGRGWCQKTWQMKEIVHGRGCYKSWTPSGQGFINYCLNVMVCRPGSTADGAIQCPVQPLGPARCSGMQQAGTTLYPPPQSCLDRVLLSARHIQNSSSHFNPTYPSRTLVWPPVCAVQSVLKWGGLPSLDQTPEKSHVLSQTLARNKCVGKTARNSRISKRGSIAGISF